jgi:hypothetical protein
VSGRLLLLVPLVFVLGGVLAVLLLARGGVRSSVLPLPVATARARGVRWSAGGVLVGLVLAGLLAWAGIEAREVGIVLAAPLAGAALHAGTALVGEVSWPRPQGRVRSAAVAVRSVRQSVPRVLAVAGLVGAVLVLTTCVGGIVVAGPWSDSYVWRTWNTAASSDTFPGGRIAWPVLAAAALATLTTALVLVRIPGRPAVPCARPEVDASLRRTAAHRVLRVTASALLGTAGVLVVLWTDVPALYGSGASAAGVPFQGPLVGLVTPTAWTGLGFVLLGLLTLVVPARGLRLSSPAAAQVV